MEKQTIGEIIQNARKAKNLTQKTLAEQLYVTDKAVSKWERNVARPDINTIPKLAEILDIPIELLLNVPVSSKLSTENANSSNFIPDDEIYEETKDDPISTKKTNDSHFDYERETYKSKSINLLAKGTIGFLIGFAFFWFTSIADNESFNIGYAAIMGLFFAGVPHGYEILGKIIGDWYVVGNIAIMIIVFVLKFTGAIMIGWITYPFALLSNLVKAQSKGSIAKKIFICLYAIYIVFFSIITFILIRAMVFENENKVSNIETVVNDTAPPEKLSTSNIIDDISLVDTTDDFFHMLCDKSLTYATDVEKNNESGNYKIVTPSSIKSMYFITPKTPGAKYHDFSSKTIHSNAFIVITSYDYEVLGVDRTEWIAWVYPDISLKLDNTYMHNFENEYEKYLSCNTIEEVNETLAKIYSDFNIVELLPSYTN